VQQVGQATSARTIRRGNRRQTGRIWLPGTQIAPATGAIAGVPRPIAVVDAVNTASPATWWVHTDHLNRPVQMTDATKATVWQATWLPFGAPQAITGTSTLDARFPGQWFQLESGLHQNWWRHYDPTTGRYTQSDPLEFVDGQNIYGYVVGSPFGYVDPTGEGRFDPIIKWTQQFIKKLHFEGPGADFLGYGHGRICQVRYNDWFVRLDFDPIGPGQPPSYHLTNPTHK